MLLVRPFFERAGAEAVAAGSKRVEDGPNTRKGHGEGTGEVLEVSMLSGAGAGDWERGRGEDGRD